MRRVSFGYSSSSDLIFVCIHWAVEVTVIPCLVPALLSFSHSSFTPSRSHTHTMSSLTYPNFKQSKRRQPRPEISEEQKLEIKEAFDLFDINKDGSIDYHELKYVLSIGCWWL